MTKIIYKVPSIIDKESIIVKAYPGIPRKRKIGEIEIANYLTEDCYRIENFEVDKAFREQGVGKELFNRAEEVVKKLGGTHILVYPAPIPTEESIPLEELYIIYQHLRFRFTKVNVNLKESSHEMIKYIF